MNIDDVPYKMTHVWSEVGIRKIRNIGVIFDDAKT